jgi:hypothetical protein
MRRSDDGGASRDATGVTGLLNSRQRLLHRAAGGDAVIHQQDVLGFVQRSELHAELARVAVADGAIRDEIVDVADQAIQEQADLVRRHHPAARDADDQVHVRRNFIQLRADGVGELGK